MRALTIAVAIPILLGCAGDARAQGNRPSYNRIRGSVQNGAVAAPISTALQRIASVRDPSQAAASRTAAARARSTNGSRANRRDSLWNGLLIGGAIGAGGGYLWASSLCGANDAECFAVAGPVGILSGAGIGAAVGAVLDALTK